MKRLVIKTYKKYKYAANAIQLRYDNFLAVSDKEGKEYGCFRFLGITFELKERDADK
jgi:hypothetical protein